MIELKDRSIEWLYLRIKELDDYDLRKILSEELLHRELDMRTIDEDAIRIALEYCSYEKLSYLVKSPNPCVTLLVYREYENRIANPRINGLIHERGEKVKIMTRKDRFDNEGNFDKRNKRR